MGRDVAAGVVVDIFQTQSQEDLLIYQLWSVSKRNTSRKSLKKKKKTIYLSALILRSSSMTRDRTQLEGQSLSHWTTRKVSRKNLKLVVAWALEEWRCHVAIYWSGEDCERAGFGGWNEVLVSGSMLALSIMAMSMTSRSRPRVGSWVFKPGVQGKPRLKI